MIRAILLGLCLASPAFAGGENRVRDGDTVVVSGTPIRLKGLSCDELKTEAGQSQKLVLMSHFNSASEISCILTGETTYDREVGWCSLDGKDIGELMIETTNCQPCRRYDTEGRYDAYPVTGDVPKYCNPK